ncbi:MAG TPA: branched-chain amino acid ABC transporter permease [Thermoprotei archaeon]|nr:branched-chain amino acid ABC transporter permease [Thermoprotei archaeon]
MMFKIDNELYSLITLFIFLAVIPQFLSIYNVRLLSVGLLYGLAAVGFNLLYGYTGLLSFGHAMFWSAGAYGLAIGLVKLNLDPLMSILLAFTLTFTVAIVTGYLSLRHTEIYFAMLTLAFAQLIYALIIKLRDITGGDEGIYGIPRFPSDIGGYYYLIYIIVFILVILAWWIVRTPLGLGFQAVRDNPYRAEALGLDVRRVRLISFVLSGFYLSIAGMLYAPLNRAITPDIAFWTFSAIIVIMTIIGGSKNVLGAFIGGLIFIYINTQAMNLTEFWQLTLGIILALLVYLAPYGIVGIFERVLRYVRGG